MPDPQTTSVSSPPSELDRKAFCGSCLNGTTPRTYYHELFAEGLKAGSYGENCLGCGAKF